MTKSASDTQQPRSKKKVEARRKHGQVARQTRHEIKFGFNRHVKPHFGSSPVRECL